MQTKDNQDNRETPKDPQLDIPSVANQTKHIDFREIEDADSRPAVDIDIQQEEAEKRRKEWHDGIEEGKQMRNSSEGNTGD